MANIKYGRNDSIDKRVLCSREIPSGMKNKPYNPSLTPNPPIDIGKIEINNIGGNNIK